MVPLTRTAPDADQILADIGTVLAWDLAGPSAPSAAEALGLVERFTVFGRVIAADLRALCLALPADSKAGQDAHAVLDEASLWLYLSPAVGTAHSAAHRAQNLARLADMLLRAVEAAGEEQARSGRHQHTSTKGIR